MKKVVKKEGKPETEYEMVRNYETREKFLKQKGGTKPDGSILNYKKAYDAFIKLGEKDEKWKNLRDIPVPKQYMWIWKHFLNIWAGCEWNMGGQIIFTFQTVNEYVKCFNVPFTREDKQCLFKMKAWALNTIAELKEE